MVKTVRNISLFIAINLQLVASLTGISPVEPVSEGIFKKSINSLLLHRAGWKLSYPIIELNSDTGLEMSFDDLSSRVNNYSYRIMHCDHNWIPSRLTENEYIDGLLENQILDYTFSFNTNISYIHFRLNIPNEDISLKLSGNYVIIVYEDFDPDKVVFIRKFVVTEKIVNIQASVKRPMLNIHRNSGQEVDFSIFHGSYPVHDPFSEIHVIILQNGRWDNAITRLKPLFVRSGSLEYDYDNENVFPGSSEFRWFDIKSMRYQSPYIKNVDYRDNTYQVELFPDESRAGKQYFFEDDLNGKYYVEVQEQTNDDTDADYVNVYFTLPYNVPLTHGNMYILGGLTNWIFNDNNKLSYNFETRSYEAMLLLKQGYYNYQYVFLEEGQSAGDGAYAEGNHYETENDYIILVYHQPVNSRYDRIIGYQIINSLYGEK